jgi:hypothetical protein
VKPTLDYGPELFDNASEFTDDFFKRFELKTASEPLALDDKISKDYLFPTLYGDVTNAVGIFLCSYDRAAKMMLHPKMKPVRMTKGRSLVAFSCYIYRNVLGVPAYNEIAMTIPVMMNASFDLPVLPMVLPIFKGFGYRVFSMPVTSSENNIRGHKLWGLPKVVQQIDIREEGGDCVTTAMEENDGPEYFELRVPMAGQASNFDVRSSLYSKLDGRIVRSTTHFKGPYKVTKHMNLLWKTGVTPDREYLRLGNSPSGKILQDLDIDPHPFQLRYAKRMNSCFELPDPSYAQPQ